MNPPSRITTNCWCLLLALAFCAVELVSCGSQAGSLPLTASRPNGAVPPKTHIPAYSVLFSFGINAYALDGGSPRAGLITVDGTFYGTTTLGGAYGYGTVFSVTKSGYEKVLHSFTGHKDGAFPVARLLSIGGTLYGTSAGPEFYGSSGGYGTIFKIGKSGKGFRVLYSFSGGADGASPVAGLTDVNGTLFGTTSKGGMYGEGTVFSIGTGGGENVLHSFSSNPDGAYPAAELINVNGTLYGTTEIGGRGAGTVFSITREGAETVLYSFTSAPDGHAPVAALIAEQGNLYGTTYLGGEYEAGTVFSMSTTGANEQVLHSFDSNGSDGTNPMAGLTTLKGLLYGTTYAGGAADNGTVFSIATSGTETVLHSFGEDYQNDGAYTYAQLVAIKGTLYGTTYEGGISEPSCPRSASQDCDYGTVFTLTP